MQRPGTPKHDSVAKGVNDMDMNRRNLLLSGAGVAAALTAATPSLSQNNQRQAQPYLDQAPQPGTGHRIFQPIKR